MSEQDKDARSKDLNRALCQIAWTTGDKITP